MRTPHAITSHLPKACLLLAQKVGVAFVLRAWGHLAALLGR